jgi:SAM-dependent methyltransferase
MSLKDPYYKRLFPPSLGDKMFDWQLLSEAGGQAILQDRDVVEFGPSFGVDFYMWAPIVKSYAMIDSAPDIMAWLVPLIETFIERDFAVSLHRSNLQNALPFKDACCDMVIDFGTIDNVLAGFHPYAEAARILRSGGILVSSYANYWFFREDKSPSGDEERFNPDQLAKFLADQGCEIRVRKNEDQPRAGIVARKR